MRPGFPEGSYRQARSASASALHVAPFRLDMPAEQHDGSKVRVAGTSPLLLVVALLGSLLLVPAAAAAPQPSGRHDTAAILGGVIQRATDAVRLSPSGSQTGGTAPAIPDPASALASPWAGDVPRTTPASQARDSLPRERTSMAPAPFVGEERVLSPSPADWSPTTDAEPDVLRPQGSGARSVPSTTRSAPAATTTGGPDPSSLEQALPARELVLDRRRRQLMVIDNGTPVRRFPVAVGMPGWETPVGRFSVIEMRRNPVWEHPVSGLRIQPGPDNPLGTRWIGFYRDCQGRRGFNGKETLVVEGCVVAGFHGTPNRSSIGQAASHGCVRLYDEHVRDLFDLVRIGTPVTVLP